MCRRFQQRRNRRLLIAVAGALVFSAQFAVAEDEQPTEKQLTQLKTSIKKLERWLDTAKSKRSKIQKSLRESELEIGRVAGKIRQTSRDIENTRFRLKKLNKERDALIQARKHQEKYLAQQIRAAYGIGRQEYLKLLLNQEQPEKIARTLRYYDYFNQARTEQIESYSNTLAQLRENEKRTAREQEALKLSKQLLEDKRSALAKNKKARSNILLKLDSNIKNKGQELGKLVADRKQLEELLRAVAESMAELTLPEVSAPFAQLKGRLSWPAKGKIVRSFGSRDIQSRSRWNGILIRAPEGVQVKAVHHGRVVFSDWLRGFGLLVILDHGNGFMSLYGHNQSLYKATGDWVNPGEVIASVGNSGGQKQTGLYFEIRKNGEPVNPKQWILASK